MNHIHQKWLLHHDLRQATFWYIGLEGLLCVTLAWHKSINITLSSHANGDYLVVPSTGTSVG
jgi:hypothetical protein